MKTIVYGTCIDTYATVTVPPPKPSKNHLLVKVHAVGLNPVDAKVVIGDKLPQSWSRFRAWIHRKFVAGHIPGFDFSGVVVAAPDDESSTAAQEYGVGCPVFGTMPPLQGTLAEYISVPLDQVCRMPSSLSPARQNFEETDTSIGLDNSKISREDFSSDIFLQSAALPLVGLTALQCLQAHLKEAITDTRTTAAGSTLQRKRRSILVIGASGCTGHIALQVAKALFEDNDDANPDQEKDPYHITAVCSARNMDFCRQLGATHVIDYRSTSKAPTDISNSKASLTEALIQSLKGSPGCPFDFVLDCVTSDDLRDTEPFHYPTLLQRTTVDNSALLSDDYVYRRLGGPTPDWIRASLQRACSGSAGGIHGGFWWWGSRNSEKEQLFWIRFPKSSGELDQLRQWMQDGRLRVAISKVNSFSQHGVEKAMKDIMSRRIRGKVLVQIHPSLQGHGGTVRVPEDAIDKDD